MVIGAFPVAKLGVLAIKQISKPIANILKNRAKHSPFFSTYVCMPPAQFYNWCEVKTKMWAMNLGRPMAVPKLNEQMAIELGANLLGEIIIFVIGAGILLLEYQRQSRKETLKEEMVVQEKLELQALLNELAFQAERQDTQIRELTRMLAEIDSKSWTPKILNDIVGRKKIQSECSEKENPLELLPEKRTIGHQLPSKAQKLQNVLKENNSNESGKAQTTLNEAINLLLTEVFYSHQQTSQQPSFPEMKGDSPLYKALNYLFIESEDNEY